MPAIAALTGDGRAATARRLAALERASLADEVGAFNAHRLVRVHNNVWRLMWWQFLRGLAFGLGTVVGATALVSVVALILGQIEFIPIIGEIARAIIETVYNG